MSGKVRFRMGHPCGADPIHRAHKQQGQEKKMLHTQIGFRASWLPLGDYGLGLRHASKHSSGMDVEDSMQFIVHARFGMNLESVSSTVHPEGDVTVRNGSIVTGRRWRWICRWASWGSTRGA